MDVALAADDPAHGRRELGQDVRLARVADRVHGIEPEAVEAVLLEPVERVVDEEVAHRAVREVDRGAPGRVHVAVEELRRQQRQVVAVGPEVVVDDVEEDHQPEAVGLVDQALEVVGLP